MDVDRRLFGRAMVGDLQTEVDSVGRGVDGPREAVPAVAAEQGRSLVTSRVEREVVSETVLSCQ